MEVAALLAGFPIEFELGSSRVSSESADTLAKIGSVLATCGAGQSFEIAGHTDDRGPEEVNQRLSKQRADSVESALVKRGVDDGRLEAEGFGESRPAAPNSSPGGRAKNRRVEFIITETE